MGKVKKTRVTKPKKDPNRPKKPLSAYFRFMGEVRTTVKEENADLKHKELTKLIGVKWGELEAEKKAAYKSACDGETETWREEMEVYKKTDSFKEHEQAMRDFKNSTPKKKKRKILKDPNAPKKPQTAYFLYSASVREEVKMSLSEANRKKVSVIAKRIGAQWGELETSVKDEWKAKAAKLKAEYLEEFETYKKTDQYTEFIEKKKQYHDRLKNEERVAKAVAKAKAAKPVKKRRKKLAESDSDSDSEDSSSLSSSTDDESS